MRLLAGGRERTGSEREAGRHGRDEDRGDEPADPVAGHIDAVQQSGGGKDQPGLDHALAEQEQEFAQHDHR